jgi:hypothetical protein
MRNTGMKIFLVTPNVERYYQLCYDEEELKERFPDLYLEGEPKADAWKPPAVEWITEPPIGSRRTEAYFVPDIAYLGGSLALNPKATGIIRTHFADEAELLPITVGDEPWTILNVINLQDILDTANCRYKIRSDGTIGRMLKMALDKSKITNAKLFRVAGKPSRIFTSDVAGSFKSMVEDHALKGLLFDEYE